MSCMHDVEVPVSYHGLELLESHDQQLGNLMSVMRHASSEFVSHRNDMQAILCGVS